MVVIVGVTGGICSGKSTLCRQLDECLKRQFPDYFIDKIDCDILGHECYQIGTSCYESLVKNFGADIIAADGSVNRRALGGIVFGDKNKMNELNQIVWPEIRKKVEDRIQLARSKEDGHVKSIVLVEAAIMIEAKWCDICTNVWLAYTEKSDAITRLKTRNNLSEADALARIDSQMSNEDRFPHAHVLLNTSIVKKDEIIHFIEENIATNIVPHLQ